MQLASLMQQSMQPRSITQGEQLTLLPSGDELLPAITALYLTSSAESECGSATEQEHEWKEAIRAALEEDIQRQVRLRLGLSSTALPRPPSPLHTLLPSLVHRHSSPSHLHPSLPHFLTTHRSQTLVSEDQPMREKDRRAEERRRQRGKEERRREKVRGTMEKQSRHSNGHEKMDIYRYLSMKYGTPVDQLQQLVSCGAFRSSQREEGGYGIRSPGEANILLPTPQHIRPDRPDKEPLQPVKPEREVLNHTLLPALSLEDSVPASRGKRVYDSSSTEVGEEAAAATGVRFSGRQQVGQAEGNGGLQFESRFESGNLHHATQVTPHEYRLTLRTDLYSKRHTQWFYFQITGMEAGPMYTFHITNFVKKDSLYNYGMQPLLYSELESSSGRGWRRVGRGISYYRQGELYTLTWSMEFPHSADTCYLAHCYPYTYSHLLRYLDRVERERASHIKREVLCHTLAGNPCYCLTISDFDTPQDVWHSRGGVVISARVHPGETNSSWMMEGVIDFLTSDTPHAKSLRSNYVFKVVPMLNPDGVIVGNYRTSLAGVDLNRVYKRPVENLFPTIYHTKNMVTAFMQERELMLYVDLHGHSRKHNVFMYGCHMPQCDHTHFLNERVIPFLLSQQAPDKFSFGSCKFNVQRCKESTGRVVAWRMGVANSFTLEATFCGSTLGDCSHQFSEADLLAMGHDLCEAIHKYHKFKKSKSYQQKVHAQLAELIMANLERDRLPRPSTPPPVNLPDIVTSSTPPTITLTPSHGPKPHGHGKKQRSRHSKVLQRFCRFDMALLEEESSTSGSDSENDEFKYHSKTNCSKHRHHRKHRSLPPQHLTQPPPPPSHSSYLPTHASHTRQPAPLKLHASAPARLQAVSTLALSRKVPPPSYRFVDRYANRSNGGIPMFSEERLKERAEKKLRSLSMIQPPTEPRPPQAPPFEDLRRPHLAANLPLRTHLFLWRPNDSQDEGGQRQIAVSLRPRPIHPRTPPTLPSSLQHYHTIKKLVEHQRSQALGGAITGSSHTHWPHPLQQLKGSHKPKHKSKIWSQEMN